MAKGLDQTRATSDGSITGASLSREGWLRKIIMNVDSSDTGEILVYDNYSAATGTVICRACKAASAAPDDVSYDIDFPGAGVRFSSGLYVDLSGGCTAAQVYWDW